MKEKHIEPDSSEKAAVKKAYDYSDVDVCTITAVKSSLLMLFI